MSHDAASVTCPQCHQPLPADAPGELYPTCLMEMASLVTDQNLDTAVLTDASFPGLLSEMAGSFPELEILEKIGQGAWALFSKPNKRDSGAWWH